MVKPDLKQAVKQCLASLYQLLQRQERHSRYQELVKQGYLQIGRHTYGIPTVYVYKGSEQRVIIGNFCSISPGVVMITGGIHPLNWISTYPFRAKWDLAGAYEDGMPLSKGDIIIGSEVWIGTEAMIMSGVTIGDGAVIAARSVVTKDVSPYAVVASVPAEVIKYRFDSQVINQLLRIRWWEWDDARIEKAIPLLSSNLVEKFIIEYGNSGG